MSRLTLIVVGIVSVVLVAGAVFVAARLLNSPEGGAGGPGGEMRLVGEGGGSGQVAISLDIKPAPDLPQTPPEVGGLFVRREDNSIFVGTGEIEFAMEIDPATGEKQASSNYSGPVLEVVVTNETSIYRDETKMPSIGVGAVSGNKTIQQVVKPVDSLAELGENSKNTEVQVWGERRGDRVVAQVFVYRLLDGG
jgi:hypothetical protein